jgi:hypothetical protein
MMNREALYADASAYAIARILEARKTRKGPTYSDREQTQVLTLLSDFIKSPKQLVTEATIQARAHRLASMSGVVNALASEALEHVLVMTREAQKAANRAAGR